MLTFCCSDLSDSLSAIAGLAKMIAIPAWLPSQISGPAVFGDALLIYDEVPSCRDRLWAYHTTTYCHLWTLGAADVATAIEVWAGVVLCRLGCGEDCCSVEIC